MRDSIDIEKIRTHISILQEERREADALVEYLSIWHKQATAEGFVDVGFIAQHLLIAGNQVECINRRIMLLESIVEKFSNLKRVTAELLTDAQDKVDSSMY